MVNSLIYTITSATLAMVYLFLFYLKEPDRQSDLDQSREEDVSVHDKVKGELPCTVFSRQLYWYYSVKSFSSTFDLKSVNKST